MVFLLHNFPLWPYMRESICEVEIVCCMCRSHRWLQWNAVSYTWEAPTHPYCLHWLQSWRKFSHKVHGWNRSVQITKYHWWHIHMSRILCYWVSIRILLENVILIWFMSLTPGYFCFLRVSVPGCCGHCHHMEVRLLNNETSFKTVLFKCNHCICMLSPSK